MRNRESIAILANRTVSHLMVTIAFVVIASWCQESHASNSLWLWGWLGVADIQIIQISSPGSIAKDPATPGLVPALKTAMPMPSKSQTDDPARKNGGVTKAQTGDETRNKDGKNHSFKIIIM